MPTCIMRIRYQKKYITLSRGLALKFESHNFGKMDIIK